MKKLLLLFLLFIQSFSSCQATECRLSQTTGSPELLVFVSFSMPEQSLKLWSEQVARLNGKLLIRGFFEDSLQKTTQKTLELFGEKGGAELLIDPEAFQKFNIQVVPAVVLSENQECLTETCPPPKFDLVYGDTDLEAALKLIADRGSLQGKEWANSFLKQYRGSHE